MTVPCAVQRFDSRASFGGDHAAVLCVDTHDRLALVREAVRIYSNRFVNHNTLAFGDGLFSEKQCKGIYKKWLPYKRKPIKK